MKKLFVVGFLSLIFINLSAKKDPEAWKSEKTLESQYKTLKANESYWNGFIMIKEPSLNRFHKSIVDTVVGLEKKIIVVNNEISSANVQIESLKKQLSSTKEELEISLKKENELSTLGMDVNKSSFPKVVYSIIVIMLLIAIAAFFLYFRSNAVTKKTEKRNQELGEELKSQKSISLEREAKLARELQNERNRNHG